MTVTVLILMITLNPYFSLETQSGDEISINWKEVKNILLTEGNIKYKYDYAVEIISKFIRQQFLDQQVEVENETIEEIEQLEVLDIFLNTLPLAAEFIPDGKLRSSKALAKARRVRNAAKLNRLIAKQTAAASAGILGIFDLLVNTIVLAIQLTVPYFDPEDKEDVPEGFWSYSQLPIGVQLLFSNIPLGVGAIMDLILPIVQFGDRCPEGYIKESPGGLCYKPCKNGFKSDGAFLCYKQYPEFENNGLIHTITSITKKILTNTGEVPKDCGDGEYYAGLCYSKCRSGYKGIAGVCWADVEDVGVGKAVNLETCPSGWSDDGLVCREPIDWSNLSGGRVIGKLDSGGTCGSDRDLVDGLCYKKCPAGKSRVPGMPYLCRTDGEVSYTRSPTFPSCSKGLSEDSAGLCYNSAPEGYEKQSLGLVS